MIKHFNSITIIILIVISAVSCKKDKNLVEAEKVVQEWMGKKIIFPDSVSCVSINRDTICMDPNSTPYKILIYIDSTGCTSCKLELFKWNALIKEVEEDMNELVNFQFYFHPKISRELYALFKRENFGHPVYIDKSNRLNKLNKFHGDDKYHTLLLNENNEVVLIGNPIQNTNIWKLYKQVIKGEEQPKTSTTRTTTIEVDNEMLVINGMKAKESAAGVFILKNTGDNPLLIADIKASCGCTVPQWTKRPVQPGDTTHIKIQVTPDGKGYFRKNLVLICNIPKKRITLTVEGEVNE